MAISWTCTSCGRPVSLSEADLSKDTRAVFTDSMREQGDAINVEHLLLKCPNRECRKLDLTFRVYHAKLERDKNNMGVWTNKRPAGVGKFKFLPVGGGDLSAAVPDSIRGDYFEARLIQELSPKAAATLARRALQGMIRDFWGIVKRSLDEEIRELRTKCEPELYEAMHALRSIGNIGAHPEKDINTIIDVEQGEAEELLGLIQLLDQEWYIARENQRARLAALKKLGDAKQAAKNVSSAPNNQSPSSP